MKTVTYANGMKTVTYANGSKYAPPAREEVLEAIGALKKESLRRRARETFLTRKGWNRTSASKNGNKKRWLSPSDRVFAHQLYVAGMTDRLGERVLHCKWRNGMNFWNARADGKRLLADKRRALAKTAKTAKPADVAVPVPVVVAVA